MTEKHRERRAPRLRHTLAMQSERVYVLVGEEETPFLVPRELLIWSSPVFKAMLQDHFKEGAEGVIKLKDVDEASFAAFFIWLHQFDCFAIDETIDEDLVFDLAIFAEKYQVQRLSNQVLDRLASINGYPIDDTVKYIYDGTPPGAAARRCAVVRVASTFKSYYNKDYESRQLFREKFDGSFTSCPDFGTDFTDFVIFKRIKNEERIACFYHNHSDIPDAKPSTGTEPCPYTKRHALKGFGEDELEYDEDMVAHQHQLSKKAREIYGNEQNARKYGTEEKAAETDKQEKERKEEMGSKEEDGGSKQEDKN
ncbi:hypothetical protein KEM56_005817 [Ascosphaera pollenicola]|nr:hypothetical protein KEM56_005817 [Ascosphaera pollenicola]